MHIVLDGIGKLFGLLGELINDLNQFGEVYKLGNAKFLRLAVDPLGNVYH